MNIPTEKVIAILDQMSPVSILDPTDTLSSKTIARLWEGELEQVSMDLYDMDLATEFEREMIKEAMERCGVPYQPEHLVDYLDMFAAHVKIDLGLEYLMQKTEICIYIALQSNYDCINSHWFESQDTYRYQESYFGAMLDALSLNPFRVKQELTAHEVKSSGKFPNYRSHHGKELVTYEDFFTELENSSCGANLLVFMGRTSLFEAVHRKDKRILIPAGNPCGLYSHLYGGGSIQIGKLTRDVCFDLKWRGKSNNDRYTLEWDNQEDDYSIQNVYGVYPSVFGKHVRFEEVVDETPAPAHT